MAHKKPREVAIIGLGRFGGSLARRLEELGQSVLAIDLDPQRAKEIADEITETLLLDATDPEALEQADITAFKTVIVAIGDDFEANALVTSSLKSMGVPQIISLASSRRHRDILLRIGADRVVIPNEESGSHLADELSNPGMLSSLPLSPDYSLLQLQVPAGMVRKNVQECERYEINVLLIVRGPELLLTPDWDFRFQQGDILVVVGDKKRLAEFSSLS